MIVKINLNYLLPFRVIQEIITTDSKSGLGVDGKSGRYKNRTRIF